MSVARDERRRVMGGAFLGVCVCPDVAVAVDADPAMVGEAGGEAVRGCDE